MNTLVEDGALPGLEAAIEAFGDAEKAVDASQADDPESGTVPAGFSRKA